MITLSERARIAANRTVKEPNIVLCIDGAPYCFGSAAVKQIVKIGDPGLLIDGSWLIGGIVDRDEQKPFVSNSGSSTSIRQQLDADKGRGSSIQSMDIELIDIDNIVTELITPGLVMDDVMGAKAKVYLAIDANNALWPRDYLLLFRGVVDDIKSGAGTVTLTISHPEQKKKQAMYAKIETNLAASITNSQTTIPLVSTAGLVTRPLSPAGTYDLSFRHYIRVDDELIEYTGISGNNLTGCVRAQLYTFANAHAADAEVSSFYRITGNAMDLALKLMLSKSGPYLEDIAVSSVQVLPGPVTEPNALYFDGVDIVQEYGLTVGDYVSVSGAANGANNFTLRPIASVVQLETGSYLTVSGAPLVSESGTSALCDFRSRYDTFPGGLGLGADEVDVTQHEYLKRLFLSSFNYDLYIKEQIENAREFIEQEIYKPASAYSLPRKAQASVQMLIGPIPGANTTTLSESNIVNPSKIKLRRTINKNFYNTIVYKYDEDELEDKFLRGKVTQNATSVAQIPVGSRALVIEAKGLREVDNGDALAASAADRRLKRYAYGAEFIEGLSVLFGAGFDLEVGDIVIFDPTNLNVSNTLDGTRDKPAALYEITNKSLNWKTGEIQVDLLDTAFDEAARYGLIAPSSKISSGTSQTVFTIYQAYASIYGAAEFQKWFRYANCSVTVRSPDSTTRYATSTIKNATTNTIEVHTPLGFVPVAGDIMELSAYDDADTTDQIKLVYGHMSPLMGGADTPYVML